MHYKSIKISSKLVFFCFIDFISNVYCSENFSIEDPITERKHIIYYKVLKKMCIDDSDIRFLSIDEPNIKYRPINIAENSIGEDRKRWHVETQKKISGIDENFFPKDETNRQNLCLIRISINLKDYQKLFYEFDNFLFISGKSLYFPEISLGTLGDLDNKRYELKLHGPSLKDKPIPLQLEDIIRENSFLKRHNPYTDNLIILNISDFYPDLEEYRTHLLNFFGFQTILGRQTAEMKKFFLKKVKGYFPGEVFEKQVDLLEKTYNQSLNYSPLIEENINFLTEKLHINTDNDGLNVEENFCDSEQAIRLFLTGIDYPGLKTGKRGRYGEKYKLIKDKWEELKTHLNASIENILSIDIDIASRRYMCDTCFGTYSFDLDQDGNKTMINGILRHIGIVEDPGDIKYSFVISGSVDHGKH